MSDYKRIGIVLVASVLAYCLWTVVRPANIIRVEHSVIFVEHFPITKKGKLNWWLENKENLGNEYHIFEAKNNFTVVVMNFGGYEKLPQGTRDGSTDDYTCFDDAKNKKCIYNDIAIVIRGSINGKMFINTGGKTYIQTAEGKVILQEK
ncbi:DUF943 family protein [Erwinia pyrifoliae]|uniref:DUF943 family protein n=1 Tax=Erwinia pyrifoliae TaxID=79967 RepID=UPI00220CA307|nr:DUF943 family protein [Erwinia pyrifoliae]UWS28639.1 DUF943 family protein [Erwinia pyrifoliae]